MKHLQIIKAETQCKVLEGNLHDLQKRYDTLQEELLEHRISSARETEHWQTISALFGIGGKDNNAITPADEKSMELDDKKKDNYSISTQKNVATSTEAPVPAERKLSTSTTPSTVRRKSTTQKFDKNLSPIGSPIRRIPKGDATTQTSVATNSSEITEENQGTSRKLMSTVNETTNLGPVTSEPIPQEIATGDKETTAKPLVAVVSKGTIDAVVQTPCRKMECQSMQTENSMIIEPIKSQDESLTKEFQIQIRIMEMQEQMEKRDIDFKECKNE